MKTLFEIPDKEYILDNHQNICIYCKDNIQEVRDYLELVCGFKKANWSTIKYHTLHWLFINSSNEVHGSCSDKGHVNRPINVSISKLLKSYNELSYYKTIKLKE